MKNILLTLLTFTIASVSSAQSRQMAIGDIKSLQSDVLSEERKIVIFTPENYNAPDKKFPVLYLLDAEWNFRYVSGLVDKLATAGDIPKMIIVGIINSNRNRDLTPPEANSNPDRFGGGQKFLNFITEELQPWVEENYKTHPYRILGGHSFGGLFTIYAMMEKPGYFQSYIALSPSLGRNNERQLEVARSFFSENNEMPKDLYVAVGNEGGFTYKSTGKFAEILKTSVPGKFRFKFELLTDESHSSIPAPGFLKGLRFIYEGINPEKMPELDEIFLIEDHFEHLSERYGYEFPIPEFYFQKFVKEQIAERELDYALFILKMYEKQYPNSLDLFLSYADTYLLKGDFEKAKGYYEKLEKMGAEDEILKKLLNQLQR